MFTSIKKWVKNDDGSKTSPGPPSGMQTMRSDLQRKFSKGVQYNLKIILRGDRNTGKTCLWHRLQGHKFIEEYVPTPEIQAASIHWNYKATDDIVKVDVWDVVDQGKTKKFSDSLKITNTTEEEKENQTLDANFLDVYKGAHAVIFLFDMTKKWTFNYVEQELPKVPAHIPALVLANHRDMGSHRVVELDELQYMINGIDRPPGSAGIMFLESSMKNGFGLKYIHKFFNLPFLLLQRESLLKQLETNYLDVESCLEELQYEPTSDEQNFDRFSEMLEQKKQGRKPSVSPIQSTPPSGKQVSETNATGGSQKPTSLSVQPMVSNGSTAQTKESPVAPQKTNEPEKKGFMSRFFKSSPNVAADTNPSQVNGTKHHTNSPSSEIQPEVKNIDEFVPDSGAVDQFLDQVPDQNIPTRLVANDDSASSSVDSDENPMVAGFQEDLDSDDQQHEDVGKAYTYSDSDDDYVAQTQFKKRQQDKVKTGIKFDLNFDESPPVEQTDGTETKTVVSWPTDADKTVEKDSVSVKSRESCDATNNVVQVASVRMEDVDVSSDEGPSNHMVSNFVEDISSDEDHRDPSPPPQQQAEAESETKTPSIQLQSSDFDFLEQITNKPTKAKESSKKSSKKSDSTNDGKTDGKKHKKKKKKHRRQDDEKNEATSEKGRRKHKEVDDLEAFLGAGEKYESI
uniref:Rab-like protein 6 n=1 Tax=Phallusia mammillata TaxID=59560 RepID=A0A6F9DR66_9ASCI|nr:rab-like protein 6 [Phallusia mammillata]